MSLGNYRDVSKTGSDTNAGFQFEFTCENCSRTWKSPFQPYRRGQLAGFVRKFAYFLGDRGTMTKASGTLADVGTKGARDAALQTAIELAEQRFHECPSCRKAVCDDCWDDGARLCVECSEHGARPARGRRHARHDVDEERAEAAPAQAAGAACPNCATPMGGGRFCAECGFDMASTHKSCPGCGAMCTRAARFCTDCGHGF